MQILQWYNNDRRALQTCSCVLVLNFLYNTIFFIKNVTCYLFLCIRLYRWFDVHVSISFTTFLYLCVLEAISFVVNYERHCLKIYGVFHFSDTQCSHFFGENGVKMGYFWTFNHTGRKNSGIFYTVRFQILSRLWISNFHLAKMASLGTSFLLYAN